MKLTHIRSAAAGATVGVLLTTTGAALATGTQHLDVKQGSKVVLHVTDLQGYAEDSLCITTRGKRTKGNVRIVIRLTNPDKCN